MIVPILRVWDETRQEYTAIPAIKGESVAVPMELETIDLTAAGLPAVTETTVELSLEDGGELASALDRAEASGMVRLRFVSGCAWQETLGSTIHEPDGTALEAVALWGGGCFGAVVGNRLFCFGRPEESTLAAVARTLWSDETA